MENLRVSQVGEIATKRADQLIKDLSEGNRITTARPLIEPREMRAYFIQIIARHLTNTHKIVADV
jgi:hypothetical protein